MRALIVGIDAYARQPLEGCARDAERLERLLSQNADGSRNFDCLTLVGTTQPLGRNLLMDKLEELFSKKTEVALFYFAGHGRVDAFGGHLVTADNTSRDGSVRMLDVLALAKQSPASQIVILLDSCHGGAFGALGTDLDLIGLREGISVLSASRSSEPARESAAGGVFTNHLCAALEGGAADITGRVTVAGLYAFLDAVFDEWQQRPSFKANISRLVTLRRCKPALSLETLRELARWFPNPDSELGLDPSYEPSGPSPKPERVALFTRLQRCVAARLIEPVGTEHMYFAAMESKACRLTALGRHYWHLARQSLL